MLITRILEEKLSTFSKIRCIKPHFSTVELCRILSRKNRVIHNTASILRQKRAKTTVLPVLRGKLVKSYPHNFTLWRGQPPFIHSAGWITLPFSRLYKCINYGADNCITLCPPSTVKKFSMRKNAQKPNPL